MSDQMPPFILIHAGSTLLQLAVEQYDFSRSLGVQNTGSDGLWAIHHTGAASPIVGHGHTWTIKHPHMEFLTSFDPEEESPPVLKEERRCL